MENKQINIFNDINTLTNNSKNNVEKKVKIKPYKKYINFYQINLLPSWDFTKTSDNEKLKNIFDEVFKVNKITNINSTKIEIIEKSDTYFFGCLHKSSEPDILTEVKSTINGNDIDLNELIFEHITYFYIDYNNMCMSIIKTQRIQSSSSYIQEFLQKNSEYHFEIIPFKKEQNEIEQMFATSLKLTFVDVDNDFVILDDLNNDNCQLSQFHFEAKFKKTSDNFVKKIINKYKYNDKVKKLSISTNSEDIDILKSTFTKQVAINLSKDFKQDLNSIMISLRNELLKIINT